MSVELRIVLPRKIYELLLKKAESKNLNVNDIIILAIERILSE